MNETSFGVYSPPDLIGPEIATPFLSFAPRRIGRHILRRLDAMTAFLDEALARDEEQNATPLPYEPGWISIPRRPDDPVLEEGDFRVRVLAAVDEIRDSLAVSETKVATLVSVARNTLASWRRKEREPYPATVRTLFEIHSIIGAARAWLGPEETTRWFHGITSDGQRRVDTLQSPDGIRALNDELRAVVFHGVGPTTLPSPAELDEEPETSEVREYAPDAFGGQVGRRPEVS
jgi:hypothetical protein